jgi:hypothetical protein
MKLTITILLLLVPLAGCARFVSPETPAPASKDYTREEAIGIALNYIKGAPTFTWDGMPETLEVTGVEPLRCTDCWEVSISFETRHGGYGDRTGMMVTQVITPHTARVLVKEGLVEYAVLDERWDEMEQEPFKGR